MRMTPIIVAAVLMLGGVAKADFELTGIQQLTVSTSHGGGRLYDQSKAWIVTGGVVAGYLEVHDTSAVDLSGGSVNQLVARNSSTVNMAGGSVTDLYASDANSVDISGGDISNCLSAYGTSIVNVSGGSIYKLWTYGTGTVNVSGGSLSYCLDTWQNSTVTFIGKDFHLGAGLAMYGDHVLGTGILSGEWSDGTPWTVNIRRNESPAIIRVVPEPATLSLLALGGLAMMRKQRK